MNKAQYWMSQRMIVIAFRLFLERSDVGHQIQFLKNTMRKSTLGRLLRRTEAIGSIQYRVRANIRIFEDEILKIIAPRSWTKASLYLNHLPLQHPWYLMKVWLRRPRLHHPWYLMKVQLSRLHSHQQVSQLSRLHSHKQVSQLGCLHSHQQVS